VENGLFVNARREVFFASRNKDGRSVAEGGAKASEGFNHQDLFIKDADDLGRSFGMDAQ